MILVTHEMQFAREVSHKVLFLHRGRVEEEGTPADLFGQPRSERLRQFLSTEWPSQLPAPYRHGEIKWRVRQPPQHGRQRILTVI